MVKRKRVHERPPPTERVDGGREHITKYLQRVYNFVNKESDLYWGLKQDDIPENTKRVPGQTKKQKTEGERTTISEGYGEATLGSISRLLNALETLPDEELRLNSQSSFIDIGSGFGKVVFHAKLFSGVQKSAGIEYVHNRHEVALRTLEHFRFDHIIDGGAEKPTNKRSGGGKDKKSKAKSKKALTSSSNDDVLAAENSTDADSTDNKEPTTASDNTHEQSSPTPSPPSSSTHSPSTPNTHTEENQSIMISEPPSIPFPLSPSSPSSSLPTTTSPIANDTPPPNDDKDMDNNTGDTSNTSTNISSENSGGSCNSSDNDGDKENKTDNTEGEDLNSPAKLAALLEYGEVVLLEGDATLHAPFNYTHVYMYDCIFSEGTYAKLLPQLEQSPFKVLVSFRTLPYLRKRGLRSIKEIGSMRMTSTGRQTFKAHIYAKTPPQEKEEGKEEENEEDEDEDEEEETL